MADVVVLRPEADFTRVNAPAPQTFSVAYRAPGDASLAADIRQARALVIPAVGPKLDAALFEGSALKLVQVTGAGLDRLDRAAMEKLGIPVANVPGGSNAALAEYAVTCAATLLRRFAWSHAEILKGNYAAYRSRMLADNLGGLEGLLVGIVGFGTIGVAVARAFKNAGARLCYYDPAPPRPEEATALGAQSMPLDALLAAADVVSLHVPLIPATRNLIGDAQLALMKPDAVLVQAARGGIVDEAALAAALENGKIGGAAVDVYTTEPPTPDNPLLNIKGEGVSRLLLTPHIAGVTRQSAAFLFRSSWDNVERVVVRGEAPLNRAY
ncbi:MAG TPA: NAD(P)-dependent oxidoreductase [Pseudolabrys sp.]|nr:NAD(P)-dependent oxidoreductase [Pseudolabrys sp.]